MSARYVPGPSRRLTALYLLPCVALALFAAPAQAQSASESPESPIAPAAPPVAPPAPDAPAPAPSVPAPPSQAPSVTEPTPAATPTPAVPADGAAVNPEPPAGKAAFAPLPPERPESKKPKAEPHSPPPAEEAAPNLPPKPVAHAAYDESPKDQDDDSGGLLGPFRLGFLIGTGLPEVANLGAQMKLTRFIGAGVNVGLIPTVKISYYGDATLKYQEYDAYGRIYPFGGAFFLGAGVGYANIKGTLSNRFNLTAVQAMYPGVPGIPGSVDVNSDATVRTLVLTPQIGFMKIFDVGFAIGLDVGAQIPIAPSKVDFSTAAPGLPSVIADAVQRQYINPNDEKVRSTLDKIGRTPLPTFNLKIGWFL